MAALSAVAVSAAPSLLLAQDAAQRRIAMTVSGGVSLGSYQAGATWALVYLLRERDALERARQSDVSRSARFAQPPLRSELDVLAGASAGNINAIIAAMEYCNDGFSSKPEASLFWKAWIPIDYDSLTGRPVADSEPGVFTRAAFQSMWDTVRSRLATTPVTPKCSLALGITTTKLVANRVELAKGVDAPVQRFAAVFRTLPSRSRMVFVLPDKRDIVADDMTDVLILDPAVSDAQRRIPRKVPGTDTIELALESLRAITEASGAFPVAFAPRRVPYRTAEELKWDSLPVPPPCKVRSTAGPECERPIVHRFVDGGVFDNRPLGIALSLSKSNDGRGTKSVLPAFAGQRILYFIDDDARRSVTEDGERPSAEARGGLAGAMQVVGGLFNTGQNYEMRLFAKRLRQENAAGYRAALGVNSRFPQLMADHFSHFGAFLSLTFREHDFYAGVYDGLRSALREIYCRPPAEWQIVSDERRNCEVAWMRIVLHQNRIALDEAGKAVVQRLFELEEESQSTEVISPAPHTRLLVKLVEANVDIRREADKQCKTPGLIETPLCSERLMPIIHAWRDSLRRGGPTLDELMCERKPKDRGGCDLVQDPRAAYHTTILRTLERTRRVEVNLDETGGDGTPSAVGLALFVERAYNEQFRSCTGVRWLRCWDLNPTAADVFARGWFQSTAIRLLPQSFGAQRSGDTRWLQWRPTVYLARWKAGNYSVATIAPVELNWRRGDPRYALGGGALLIPPWPFVSNVAVSRMAYTEGRSETDVNVALLAGLVRIGVRGTGYELKSPLRRFTIGVGDVNGLIYRFADGVTPGPDRRGLTECTVPAGPDGFVRRLAPGSQMTVEIRSEDTRNHTGIEVVRDAKYRMTVDGGWKDGRIKPVSAAGFPSYKSPLFPLLYLAAPFRRSPFGRWFELTGELSSRPKQFFRIRQGIAEWTAPADGELVAFANDIQNFYGNNRGCVTLTVERLVRNPQR
jgi:hypothetical protein